MPLVTALKMTCPETVFDMYLMCLLDKEETEVQLKVLLVETGFQQQELPQ